MSSRVFLAAALIAAIATPAAAQQAPQPQQQAAPPASADQPLSRQQFIADMDTEYAGLDADGNGQVTPQEVMQAQRNLAYNQAYQQNQQIFVQLDGNSDGVLTAQEFAQLVNPQSLPVDPAPLMQAFDVNGDGVITLVEYRVRTQANFDAADTDRDGVVTSVEMRAAGLAN